MLPKCLIFALLLCSSVYSRPTREGLEVEGDQTDSNDKHIGQKALDKFDQVFYGLLDETLQYVTDDKKGAFKDMVLRHREDFANNVKQNLVNKDKITLDDVKATVSREMDNRLELFKYVGSGVWNKLNVFGKQLYGQYQDYCRDNSKSFACFNTKGDGKGAGKVEREDRR